MAAARLSRAARYANAADGITEIWHRPGFDIASRATSFPSWSAGPAPWLSGCPRPFRAPDVRPVGAAEVSDRHRGRYGSKLGPHRRPVPIPENLNLLNLA
jgi:hypothetical protein